MLSHTFEIHFEPFVKESLSEWIARSMKSFCIVAINLSEKESRSQITAEADQKTIEQSTKYLCGNKNRWPERLTGREKRKWGDH